MTLTDIILLIVIAAILIIPSIYIYRKKKSGAHCIGCPDAGTCNKCDSHTEPKPEEHSSCGCNAGCGGCGGDCHSNTDNTNK